MDHTPKDGKYNSSFYYVPENICEDVYYQLGKGKLVATIYVGHADIHTIYDIREWLEAEGYVTRWDSVNYKVYAARTQEDLNDWNP